MKYFDLSHLLTEQMPVYPGGKHPSIKKEAQVDLQGYRETTLEITSHTGTHIDAPAHMLPEGRFLDQYPPSQFTGKALILPIPTGNQQITKKFLNEYREEIKQTDFLLFRTGWGNKWGSDPYFRDFPVMNKEAASFLASFTIKGVGMDTPSPDPVETTRWENHMLLFNQDKIILENLFFPESLSEKSGELFCFPLFFMEADGAPVRVILRII